MTWQAVANLPGFLSLNATIATYSGGAHGNVDHDALVWDKQAQLALDPVAMFASPAALEAAVRGAYCKGLQALRNARGSSQGQAEGESQEGNSAFPACPRLDELTVLLGSSSGRDFDRIGLQAAPYVAGSYAEGTYEVTMPVTPEVLGVVKPAYRRSFSALAQ